MLVIKNTEFIFNLYNNEHFNFINFEKSIHIMYALEMIETSLI